MHLSAPLLRLLCTTHCTTKHYYYNFACDVQIIQSLLLLYSTNCGKCGTLSAQQPIHNKHVHVFTQTSSGSRISPRRGRQLPGGGGRQDTILPNFPKNCMKLKEFGPRGGVHVPHTPLRSATANRCRVRMQG